MSFVINEAKVFELLGSNENGYTVSVNPLEPRIDNYYPLYGQSSGTITTEESSYAVPVLVTPETELNFMSARRQIEESGVPLKSAEELTNEIDAMRHRN
jgi:hypothetical protein